MCTFCSIINRELEGYFVYEDDKFAAILDKYPVSLGHTLVIPKNHFENYLEADEDTLAELAKVVKLVSLGIKDAVKADGLRLLTNIGRSAGQVIFHLHVHIIPTWEGDYPDIFKGFKPRKEQEKEYYELLQKIIRESIENLKRKIGDYKWG
ncbi:HIT family protein [Sulfolobus sp. S-194]|uniref:HIT family protein n=1 Tax=Sulfolobus sp. S-194 TaxID=2512240 RepID=UPI001436DF31|nr:HIT family protein [Sulfolobus sp. S-194]QIW24941.1 HIT family protein [Sulfolobus sp. S-194]